MLADTRSRMNPEPTVRPCVGIGGFGFRLINARQDFFASLPLALAGFRNRNTSRSSIQQARAQMCLERRDCSRCVGGRDRHAIRRRGVTACFAHSNEYAHVLK